MKFSDLGLCQSLLDAVSAKGYDTPSPIQAKAIPAILEGKDVMAAAQTGTGKTAGFTLPILENLSKGTHAKYNQTRVLVLTPTRELAAQVAESVKTYGQNLPLRSAVVFGGVKINPQMQKLRGGVDILVATPGRLLDLYSQNAVKFDHLEVLVLDEADRMLDMGFIHDIRKIIKVLPQKRQNLMFSATFSKDIRQLAKTIVNQPVEISVTPENAAAPTVKQWIVPVDKARKAALLIKLIKENDWWQVLVFSRTKHGANKLAKKLDSAGINAAAIHGNKSQGARTRALADFKAQKVQVLVATDIAARGLDIDQLPQVVNFDLPNVPEDYVHRIGRTGRAGSEGQAVSLVSADELQQLRDIERLTKKLLEREYVDDFEPQHDVPETQLNTKAFKPKKPKKPKSGTGGQRSGSGHGSSRTSSRTSSRGNEDGNNANNAGNNKRRRRKPSSGNTNSRNANPGNSKSGNQSSNNQDSGNSKTGNQQSKEQNQTGQKNTNRTISSGAGRTGDNNSSWPNKKRQRPKNDPRGPKRT